MLELKRITREGIPRALAKAERYRLLNEAHEAESICRDILAIDADNQEVLVMLLLSITDQFGKTAGPGDAHRVLVRLRGEYERAYYTGVVSERWAKSWLRSGGHHGLISGFMREALECFAAAMKLAPAGDDDAILRWNACVRFLQQNPQLRAEPEDAVSESGFPDGAPAH